MRLFFIFLPLLLFAAILRFYNLHILPGEVYNDLILVYDAVAAILTGTSPHLFDQSVGHVYSYIVSPFFFLFGYKYIVLKSVSVLVGLFVLGAVYILAYQLSGSALTAAFSVLFMAFSRGHIIFSRLGDNRILVPLFSSVLMIVFIHFLKRPGFGKIALLGILTGLSFYTYTALWIFPFFLFVFLFFHLFFLGKGFVRSSGYFFLSVFLTIVISMPLVRYFSGNNALLGSGGYIGSKFLGAGAEGGETVRVWLDNLKKTALMFHLRGDIVFRVNPGSEPHLDMVSGVFFLLGLLVSLRRPRVMLYVLLPLVVLVLPSTLVVKFPNEVPSAGRTIAALPFVFILTGMGMTAFCVFLRRFLPRYSLGIAASILVAAAAYLNFTSYFVTYKEGLPNNNIAYAALISSNIDKIPDDTRVYLTASRWGAWEQPEEKAIYYQLRSKKGRENLFSSHITDCSQVLTDRGVYIIFRPDDPVFVRRFASCFSSARVQKHFGKDGLPVFVSLYATAQ